jgi:phosphatidylinositol alpha 1,6-mannosyltransferase
VLIAAECFLPSVNGVTHSVLRTLEHLERRGHEALVVAPAPGSVAHDGHLVERVPGVAVPSYPSLSVGLAGRRRIDRVLDEFRPDVVHLAAPFLLGARVAAAARRRSIPVVAVYQTDVAGFAAAYNLGRAAPVVWRWLRHVHGLADVTLVPSTLAAWQLRRHGIGPVHLWRRGVDAELFSPGRRTPALARRIGARPGETIVGSMGRLAPEKRLTDLAHVLGIPGARLVVVGDGPVRDELIAALPGAHFSGHLGGTELAETVASFDVFVHTGPDETFCQAVQEALASGVPVVAPASGGPMDLVAHGETGWLYPAGSPDLLRPAVESLVADASLRQRMGGRARTSVAHRTWESVGDDLLAHYRALVPQQRLDLRQAA